MCNSYCLESVDYEYFGIFEDDILILVFVFIVDILIYHVTEVQHCGITSVA